MTSQFKGIYAATIVPLKKNKKIDKKSFSKHIKNVSNTKGIKGLLINGHAGENFTLCDDEQIKLVKLAKKDKKKRY